LGRAQHQALEIRVGDTHPYPFHLAELYSNTQPLSRVGYGNAKVVVLWFTGPRPLHGSKNLCSLTTDAENEFLFRG